MPKNDLFLQKPIMNAAGTLGFSPDTKGQVDLSKLGAFVTNPISIGARTPAKGSRFQSYPGGFLLHSGLPNPGLYSVIRYNQVRWARGKLPVIVHLLALDPVSLAGMVERLEALEGVIAVEVGLPPDIDPDSTYAFAKASIGELPAILRLPLEKAEELAPAVIDGGGSAVSLGAPRGMLNDMHGRMYGPGIFPLALRTVEKLAQLDTAVIGACGVYQPEDVNAMLKAGAFAVQIDAVLWRGYLGNP